MITRAKELIKLVEDEQDDFDYEEETGPEEDDIIISDTSYRGDYTITSGNEEIGKFNDYEDAEKAIVKWINKNKFHPNIWLEDDHGGYSRYSLESKNKKKIKI